MQKMTSLNPRNTFVLSLLFSWICGARPEVVTVVKIACMNKVLDLPCPVQDPLGDFIWKYKEKHYVDWQEIGSFSKNITSLSKNIPPKFKNNIKVFSNGSLSISSLARYFSGIYNCQLDNEGKVLHRMFKVVAVNCEKTVCEEDDAMIECELLKNSNLLLGLNQPTELHWKNKETTLLAMGPSMNVTYENPNFSNIRPMKTGGLIILSASEDISGQRYTCVLHGEKGVTSRQYTVTINVQKCQNKISEACEGGSVDVKCPYHQLLATSTKNVWIEWYNESNKIAILRKHQGHAILSESSLLKIDETNSMVTLMSLRVFDSGTYRCTVFRDKVLQAEHRVTLIVKQCLVSSTGHQMLNKTGPQDPKENKEAKPKAEKIRDICLLVFFAVFVTFFMPICLYRMAKKRRRIPDQIPVVQL